MVNDMGYNIIMKTQRPHLKTTILHHSDDQPHLIREIIRSHQALMGIVTRKIGIPSAKFALLRLLAISYPEEIGVMKLARTLNINAAAVTRQIKTMETEGLVSRLLDSQDGRRNNVILTPDGAKAFETIHKRAHEFEDRLYHSIKPDDLATTLRVLTQVRTTIEELH